MAQCRLPSFVFEYLEGGAEDEVTLRRNRAVFEDLAFVPTTLVKAGAVDTTRTIFDQPAKLPLMIAPMGFCGLFSHRGDVSLARAASAAGIPFIQSTVSNASIEDIAAVPGLRHWMQLYVFRSRPFMERLVARALAANCEALVITTDASVFGNREWDRRNYRRATEPTFRNKVDVLLHPRWMRDVVLRGIPAFQNLLEVLPPDQQTLAASATWSRREVDPDLDWERVSWLRSLWPRKLVLKGLLAPVDVKQALGIGVDGVVLSNHGGRQLDGAISPMTVLPEIASRFGGDMTILIDSGFRRGTDIVKAIALGADGVLLGRPVLYGLAAGGEAGVRKAIDTLGEEFARALALLGRPSIAQLDPTCLYRADANRMAQYEKAERLV